MIRIVNPFHPAHTTHDVTQVDRMPAKAQWSPADHALFALFVCLAIAVASGMVVGMAVVCMGIGDVRAGAAAGGTTFGAVLGSLMVWRAMR
jgi:hypothetical protein